MHVFVLARQVLSQLRYLLAPLLEFSYKYHFKMFIHLTHFSQLLEKKNKCVYKLWRGVSLLVVSGH